MARVSAHGHELLTYLSPSRHGLIRYMSDGTVLRRTPFAGWKVYGTAKNKADLSAYFDMVQKRQTWLETKPAWYRTKSIPTFDTLREWESDGVCETPSGDMVEPDGEGPDGAPSWLRLFGVI